jgi:hypothetical protein
MNLLQITVSQVCRSQEQKIIYLYEAFEYNPSIKNQFIFCAKDTPIQGVAVDKKTEVIGLDFSSDYDFKIAKQIYEKHLFSNWINEIFT